MGIRFVRVFFILIEIGVVKGGENKYTIRQTVCVVVVATGRPSRGTHPLQTRLRSVGSVADTKLGGAVKGATLLQLVSLSADASQGSSGDVCPCSGYGVGAA